MTTMQDVGFAYEVGEEVVFRPGSEDEAWSIGEIVERGISGDRPRYTVRYQDGEERRVAVVGEGAIEGVA